MILSLIRISGGTPAGRTPIEKMLALAHQKRRRGQHWRGPRGTSTTGRTPAERTPAGGTSARKTPVMETPWKTSKEMMIVQYKF